MLMYFFSPIVIVWLTSIWGRGGEPFSNQGLFKCYDNVIVSWQIGTVKSMQFLFAVYPRMYRQQLLDNFETE